LADDEITMCGYMALTFCKMYNYHDSRAHGHERSRILSRLHGLSMIWYGMGWFLVRVCVELCGP
jgi:hypothetical protein